MKRVTLVGMVVILVLGFSGMNWSQCVKREMYISVDDLLKINTVVGAWRSPSPKWSSDSKQLIFSSNLNNGGPVTVSSEGGFPIRLPIKGSDPGRAPNIVRNDPRYSPNGKWISYVSSESGAPELWIWSVEDGQETQLTDLGARINALDWSPDSRWIAFSCRRYGSNDIWKVAVPSGEVYRLTSDKSDEGYPTWTPDSGKILYVRVDERRANHDVIEITADGKSPRVVVSDKDFFDGGRTFSYPFVSPDGKMVLFRSHRSGWINYWVVPIEGGESRQIAAEEADQSHARWSPDGKFIAYTSNHNGTHDLRVVSVGGGKPRVLMSPEMGVCANPEWSPDGSRISFTFTSPTRPKDLFVVSLGDGKIKQLTYSMPAGNFEERLVVPEKVTYPSTDGWTINAYLYKPKSIGEGEKFPGIVWIHGGPTAQFEELFQHQNQSSEPSLHFFVQNGYVILQPNIRGSSGYGKKFEDANNKCWGKCDLEDVLAGAEYLKSLPYVDDTKMIVTGRSYGGTLTMAAVTNAPGVFQAAIAESGHADWTYGRTKWYDYELGNLNKNYDLRWELSPINHVENVTTPIFVIHGKDINPEDQDSMRFVDKLRKHGKVFRIKTFPHEGFYVHSIENRRQMLLDKLNFYKQFLKDTKFP